LQHCHQRLSILHNYFDDSTELFSDQYLAKFVDTDSAKSSFPCIPFIYTAQISDLIHSKRKRISKNSCTIYNCVTIIHRKSFLKIIIVVRQLLAYLGASFSDLHIVFFLNYIVFPSDVFPRKSRSSAF